MSRRERPPQKRLSSPSDEDAALWAHVTRDVTPARRLKSRVQQVGIAVAAVPGMPARHVLPPLQAAPHPVLTAPTPKRSPPLAELEPRAVRRIAKGRDEIEARVDLHGLRQDEAHRMLRSFLMRCHANGLRTVLVITGKGAPRGQINDRPFDLFQNSDRGVLKRNVPRWLTEPDMRAVVAGYTSAHVRHGGEGAIYVRLKAGHK